MARRAGGAQLLGGLLLFALLAAGAAPLSWDLLEPRGRATKIRVHPRGNLWATGHFMGKKSLEPPTPSPLGTAPHISLRDQRLQLSHDLLRIFLLKKALGMNPGSPGAHAQVSQERPPPPLQEAAGEHTAEVKQIMGQPQRHGLDCAHPGKRLNGTFVMAPSECRPWDQISSPVPQLPWAPGAAGPPPDA
ncbi:PREDICTED: neuromedin-B [Elephantulus edwardii]|uniref:neuromedin-B n=1 Tax=Elephantulus edwardii TaxID=28737 RepID=UPI0003F05910|nr:PREDICTED: neuromedin-B [Elephantulus edwardii]